jgi:nitrous oxide reductase accessory protein NosL
LGAIGGSAGCLNTLQLDRGNEPGPVDLSGGKLDYHGGMKIGMHGGPNGQIFYKDNEPEPMGDAGGSETRQSLAWFHTLVYGLFPYHFRRLNQGWKATAIYVTDYSTIEWELFERDGNKYMPAPTHAETFSDATELAYVAESEVMGGMGTELIPFSDPDDAANFVTNHGGQTVSFDQINRQMVRALQRAGEQ